MNALLTTIIVLLGKLVPAIGNNAELITTIVTALEQLVPVLLQEYKDLVPEVQNIIAAVKGTDGISIEQWNSLDILESQIDSEFDQSAKDEGL